MSEQLLSPAFLFRYAFPLRYRKEIWTAKGIALDESFRLPSFAELEGRKLFADFRGAWNEKGLSFTLKVVGKQQTPWCRSDRCEDSDGLQVWIDTRDTHNIHRASRFCHRLVFMPGGRGRNLEEPVAGQLLINRARENPKPMSLKDLQITATRKADGYELACHISGNALTGFEPEEHPRLGIFYSIQDRELGWQTLSVGSEFPFQEDPSLWGTAELAK